MHRRAAVIAFLFVAFSVNGYCHWSGPSTVLEGPWGTGSAQFGLYQGDTITFDSYPSLEGVLADKSIVISDPVNRRTMVFDSNGELRERDEWTKQPSAGSMETYARSKYSFGCCLQGYDGMGNVWMGGKGRYVLINGVGGVISTVQDRPLDLGVTKERKLSPGRYLLTVVFPDRTWAIVGEKAKGYIRGMNGNLHEVGERQIGRYDYCGRNTARLAMPDNRYDETPAAEPGIEPTITVIEEYGSPVLAPNGDVYTWKRTPDTYSIIKWTWQDDPDTPPPTPDGPTELKAASSATGVTLTWKPSFQDPGCVTEYEILRSDTPGGPYGRIGLVAKGILKYEDATAQPAVTYYYRVRALSGTAYSGYSNEVMGKR